MHAVLAILTACAFSLGSIGTQVTSPAAAGAGALATVRVPVPVLAGGKPLPPGTYQIRLTNEHPTPMPGQSPDAEQWVEFVADGKVVAREIAEVLRDDDPTPVGTSSQPVRSGTRVEMLKGGEFLRISVKEDGERYLIHLPVQR